jgi:ribosomal-protein-alanine N-acetyltransferase
MLADLPELRILYTERLQLRELSPRVNDHLFKTCTDVEIKEFLGFTTDEELETEKLKYLGGLETFNKSYFIFHILEKASGNVLGSIGYHTWYRQHHRAEIFYTIRNEMNRQKGYAREAIGPTIHYGFNEMGLNRIEAMLSPQNMASVKLLQGAGFSKEGTLKKHYFINEKYEDSDVYGLLKSEYLSQSASIL